MDFYKQNEIKKIEIQKFEFMNYEFKNHVFSIILNRPKKKNALHPQMLNELAYLCQYAHSEKKVRAVVFKSVGDVFCSGLDLTIFSGDYKNTISSISKPKSKILLGELLTKLHKPKICQLEGNVFAGGILILAGCNYVISKKGVLIGLPEVKRGIFPFQVMESLSKIIPQKKLIDWCIRGCDLKIKKAKKLGIIDKIVELKNIEKSVQKWLSEIIENSPIAINYGLEAVDKIYNSETNHEYLSQLLEKSSNSNDAKEGIKAFLEKRKPKWK